MLIVFTVYAPTNSGLQFVREQGLSMVRRQFPGAELDIIEERGEAIPGIMTEYRWSDERVICITGSDLYAESEYGRGHVPQMQGKGGLLELQGKGPYADAIFGLPALCLLGEKGISPSDYSIFNPTRIRPALRRMYDLKKPGEMTQLEGKTVMIPKRYASLIKAWSRIARDEGQPEWVELDGQVEVTAAKDKSVDYAIDIVVTGKTLAETGMGVCDVIYLSDGMLLTTRDMLREVQDLRRKRMAEASNFLSPLEAAAQATFTFHNT